MLTFTKLRGVHITSLILSKRLSFNYFSLQPGDEGVVQRFRCAWQAQIMVISVRFGLVLFAS